MKNILLSTLIIASLFVGTANVNAQTKAKSDATVINNDTKLKPVTNATTVKAADKKVSSTTTATKNNTTQNNVVSPPVSNSKAVSPKKVLKKINKDNAVATPVVNTSDIKKE